MRNFAAMHVADGAVRFTAPVASEAGSDDDNAVVSAGADGVRREATGAARLASLPLPKRSYGNMEYACRTRDRADYRGSPSLHALWLWCRGPCATDSFDTDLCCLRRRQRSRREFRRRRRAVDRAPCAVARCSLGAHRRDRASGCARKQPGGSVAFSSAPALPLRTTIGSPKSSCTAPMPLAATHSPPSLVLRARGVLCASVRLSRKKIHRFGARRIFRRRCCFGLKHCACFCTR